MPLVRVFLDPPADLISALKLRVLGDHLCFFAEAGFSYCPFLQNKMHGLLVPFESLDTHSNKKLASLSFSARRALKYRPIRL